MLAGTAVTVNAVLRGPGRFAASAISSARFKGRGKSVQAFEEEFFAKVRPLAPRGLLDIKTDCLARDPRSRRPRPAPLRVGGEIKSAF